MPKPIDGPREMPFSQIIKIRRSQIAKRRPYQLATANVPETIQTERAQLDGLLAQLSAEQMCQTALENQ